MPAEHAITAHIRDALDEFERHRRAADNMGPATSWDHFARFRPMLEARLLALDEQRWVREQLRGRRHRDALSELLVSYWFLLYQLELKADANFAQYPAAREAVNRAATRALADVVSLRTELEQRQT